MIPLATIRTYEEFHAALRARADELGVSRETIDELGCLTDGHASKLLAPNPIKIIGRVSFGPMLQALGLMLLIVEDPEALARTIRKGAKRDDKMVRYAKPSGIDGRSRILRRKVKLALHNHMSALGRSGGRARMAQASPSVRRRLARTAAKVRWSRRQQEPHQ